MLVIFTFLIAFVAIDAAQAAAKFGSPFETEPNPGGAALAQASRCPANCFSRNLMERLNEILTDSEQEVEKLAHELSEERAKVEQLKRDVFVLSKQLTEVEEQFSSCEERVRSCEHMAEQPNSVIECEGLAEKWSRLTADLEAERETSVSRLAQLEETRQRVDDLRSQLSACQDETVTISENGCSRDLQALRAQLTRREQDLRHMRDQCGGGTGPAPVPVQLSRADVRKVQQALTSLGYAPGPVDGRIGRKTRAAVRRWQANLGLPASGTLSVGQMQLLINPMCPAGGLHTAPQPESRFTEPPTSDRTRAPELMPMAVDSAERITGPLSPVSTPEVERSTFRDCSTCPEMVYVPSGQFMMGASRRILLSRDNERPERLVRIPKPFYIGRYEITFDEWRTCSQAGACASEPDDQGWGRGRRPVINVSWLGARRYVEWLSNHTERSYRLPSEAEWEYAARAGTTGPFHTGHIISDSQANFDASETYNNSQVGRYRQKTVLVGQFPPNDFGLFDVHGNVWEWVSDCYKSDLDNLPNDGAPFNPLICISRIARGGSWFSPPSKIRVTYRYEIPFLYASDGIGFRVAASE